MINQSLELADISIAISNFLTISSSCFARISMRLPNTHTWQSEGTRKKKNSKIGVRHGEKIYPKGDVVEDKFKFNSNTYLNPDYIRQL
jgi:hypothetical protein